MKSAVIFYNINLKGLMKSHLDDKRGPCADSQWSEWMTGMFSGNIRFEESHDAGGEKKKKTTMASEMSFSPQSPAHHSRSSAISAVSSGSLEFD